MNARDAFLKISTDSGAIGFARMITSGKIEDPFSIDQWNAIIAFQAEANFPGLSKSQSFSRYLDTPVGRELFWASKASPDAAPYLAKAAGDRDPLVDTRKRDNELRGPAHAQMHSLAVDRQRATGRSYEQSYAAVYSDQKNEALRGKVKREHLAAMTQDQPGIDDDGKEFALPGTMTLDEAMRLSPAPAFSTAVPGDRALVAQQTRGYSNPKPPPSARKSAAEKERAQRAYLASGASWPSV